MDPFAVIILGGIGVVVVALVLLGRFYPGSGADQLDWRPARSPEVEFELELRDVQQMIDAQNVRRRARGEAELTETQIHERIEADRFAASARRDAYVAESDLEEMLAATNTRRRRRGLPDLTVAQLEDEIARRGLGSG
ncbi:MAG: hypothetical protein ACR2HD_12225 [Solirubrobacteraceae bacterium]|nr:MAG: hypothetical protein DLM63_02195 [Solirubrobacterales bacterium]